MISLEWVLKQHLHQIHFPHTELVYFVNYLGFQKIQF